MCLQDFQWLPLSKKFQSSEVKYPSYKVWKNTEHTNSDKTSLQTKWHLCAITTSLQWTGNILRTFLRCIRTDGEHGNKQLNYPYEVDLYRHENKPIERTHMQTPADQDKINTVLHVSTLSNPYTDIHTTPTLNHIALSPLVSLSSFYTHRMEHIYTETSRHTPAQ